VVRAEFFRAVVFEQASARASETIDKEVVLLDFGGMSLGLLKLTSLFKAMNAVGSTYFPERTVLFFVLNAPRAFSTLWSIVRYPCTRLAARALTQRRPRGWSTRARRRRCTSCPTASGSWRRCAR
jgi:hypothetical protein